MDETAREPTSDPMPARLSACPCCGLLQRLPRIPETMRACCFRCGTTLPRARGRAGSNARTAAIALAALILFPLGITLPMLRIEQFGHHHESSVLDGTAALLAGGHFVVGSIVFLCSIVLPLAKLLGLLVLSGGGLMLHRHHRAWTYRFIEWTGRWGMLDVLAVAILVAVVKLRDAVDLTAGPGAVAFTSVVVLSLLAAASFNPHALWSDADDRTTPSRSSPTAGPNHE